MRIKTVSITNFGGFPGPESIAIELQGKNLLGYGENGSGKSSLFHALKGFFEIPTIPAGSSLPVQARINENVLSGNKGFRVQVEFDDGLAGAVWNESGHPCAPGSARDERVIQAANRRACLDYRALLDTNYLHGDEPVNLFGIAVTRLVRDFPIPVSGGTVRTVGELRNRIDALVSGRKRPQDVEGIRQACVEFNQGMRTALSKVQKEASVLLKTLAGEDLHLESLNFSGLTYTPSSRGKPGSIQGTTLTPTVSFRGYTPSHPQHFLNEARLTALALAIYLGGRLAAVPSVPDRAHLKLLVLDDVLIGLDHSNRLPLLSILGDRFSDWQIIFMTHDHVWFEMARYRFEGIDNGWKAVEMFEGAQDQQGTSRPVIRSTDTDATEDLLSRAETFLIENYLPAAANYTRAAFELILRRLCQEKNIKLPYRTEPAKVPVEQFLEAVARWAKDTKHNLVTSSLEHISMIRSTILNPMSHSLPPNIVKREVEEAIAAVRSFRKATKKGADPPVNLVSEARMLVAGSSSPEDLADALSYIRIAFYEALEAFCRRKLVEFPLGQKPHAARLWDRVRDSGKNLFPPNFQELPKRIEGQRQWLFGKSNDTTTGHLTGTLLIELLSILAPGGANEIILDKL